MKVVGLVFLVREVGWILWGGWRLLLVVDEVEVGVMLVGALVVVVVLGPVDGGIGFRGLRRDLGVRLLSVIHDPSAATLVPLPARFRRLPSCLVLSSPQPRTLFFFHPSYLSLMFCR